jgi:hypothetical protein
MTSQLFCLSNLKPVQIRGVFPQHLFARLGVRRLVSKQRSIVSRVRGQVDVVRGKFADQRIGSGADIVGKRGDLIEPRSEETLTLKHTGGF